MGTSSSEAARRPTAKGRPGASRPAAYRWRLPILVESQGLRASVELGPLLAERGVVLSDAQVYRLIHYVPERLSLKTLSALCDIFQCTPNDLVVPYVEGSLPASIPESRRTAKSESEHLAPPNEPNLVDENGTGRPELPQDFTPVKANLGPTKRRPADRT